MIKTLTYPVKVESAEEGGFIVTSPVISIYTQGETEEEALKNAEEAILCHLEGVAEETGDSPDIKMTMLHITLPEALRQ